MEPLELEMLKSSFEIVSIVVRQVKPSRFERIADPSHGN